MYYMKHWRPRAMHQKLNIIYNEASKDLKQLLQKRKTVVQLAPPHIHRKSSNERAISTFRNNFVADLAYVDNNAPIYLW